ncbi:type IV pili twitching motility protein PilT, partial [Aeromonas caviae]|nr:type IV pili twitching motility protein PilT [Aeromonas caviae]
MNMDVLLAALVEQKGSDLFITVDAPPTLKVNGRLVSLGPAPRDKTTALALIRESLDETHFERFLHPRA